MNSFEEDPDVIFVDFDDLFESQVTSVSHGSENDEYYHNNYENDDEILFKLLQECSDDKKEESQKRKRGPQPGRKAMTREQFYKIRPKMPRISKTDPRRSYAQAFADAYNSCDFETIWDFVSEYCTKDILFIHRWVGQEQYVNFPKYLEIKGIKSMAEYWYGRCVIVPDLVVDIKETKLYVRSDGISTVLSSFTIVCTRLYDGEVSDAIICKPAIDPELLTTENKEKSSNPSDNTKDEEVVDPPSLVKPTIEGGEPAVSGDTSIDSAVPRTPSTQSLQYSLTSSQPDRIYSRVMEKLSMILIQSTPPPKRLVGSKRPLNEIETDNNSTTEKNSNLEANPETSSIPNQSDKLDPSTDSNINTSVTRKIIPKFTEITLLGTVTLHLNQEHKIRQMELTFALKQ